MFISIFSEWLIYFWVPIQKLLKSVQDKRHPFQPLTCLTAPRAVSCFDLFQRGRWRRAVQSSSKSSSFGLLRTPSDSFGLLRTSCQSLPPKIVIFLNGPLPLGGIGHWLKLQHRKLEVPTSTYTQKFPVHFGSGISDQGSPKALDWRMHTQWLASAEVLSNEEEGLTEIQISIEKI